MPLRDPIQRARRRASSSPPGEAAPRVRALPSCHSSGRSVSVLVEEGWRWRWLWRWRQRRRAVEALERLRPRTWRGRRPSVRQSGGASRHGMAWVGDRAGKETGGGGGGRPIRNLHGPSCRRRRRCQRGHRPAQRRAKRSAERADHSPRWSAPPQWSEAGCDHEELSSLILLLDPSPRGPPREPR